MGVHSQLQTAVSATREELTVPFFDLRRQNRVIHDEINRAIAGVIEQGIFVGEPYVSRFEDKFAAYVGADYCIGVSSGTSALELTLRALGIGEGDEVIVPVNTFIATAEAVLAAGAMPVFADISDTSYHLDPNDVADRISSHTKAIIAVDLYGQPADLNALARIASSRGLVMIEDACQAHGATFGGRRVGSISHATCFSFYPSKNLGAYGEGGAVTTNDAALVDQLGLLRDHGSRTKYRHEVLGYNHRLHALQAAVLSVKLAHLDDWIDARRQIAAQYDRLLAGSSVITPKELPGRQHSYHLYVVRVAGRDIVQKRLAAAGVSTGIHYPMPLHLQPVMSPLHYAKGDFPRAEACASTILSLPIFPELRTYEVEYVSEQLMRCLVRPE